MKELSFKDLQIKNSQQSCSSPTSFSRDLESSVLSHWDSQSNLRIDLIRQKYSHVNQLKNLKAQNNSQFLKDSSILRQSKNIQNYGSSQNNQLKTKFGYKSTENQEKVVFQKIKQMKQSIIKDKVNKSSLLGRLNSEKAKNNQIQKNSDRRKEIDQRAENIDKINSKIKHILSCLYDNDKENSYLKDKNQQKVLIVRQQLNIKNSSNSEQQKINQRKINLLSMKQQLKLNLRQKQQRPELRKSYNLDEKNFRNQNQYSKIQKNSILVKQSSRINLNREESWRNLDKMNHSKTKSPIDNSSRQQRKSTNGSQENKNNQKFDGEIKKIQDKIKKFQQEKRKMNIDFKPFVYDKFQRPPKDTNYRNSEDIKKQLQNNKRQRQNSVTSFQRYPSCYFDKSEKIQITQKKLQQSIHQNSNQKSLSDFKIKLEEQRQNKINQENQLRKKMGEGIQQRKKKLNKINTNNNKNNANLKKLVKSLCQQVQIDQEFRNAKLWFADSFDSQKWNKLEKQLNNLNVQLDPSIIKQIFMSHEQQTNPFFSVRQGKDTFVTLAQKYRQSENHWNQQIQHRFNRRQLQLECCIQNKLDLEQKKFIVLEDLVRFLNIQSGTFFRNRDLYLIFKRLTNQIKLQFNTFMEEICKQ